MYEKRPTLQRLAYRPANPDPETGAAYTEVSVSFVLLHSNTALLVAEWKWKKYFIGSEPHAGSAPLVMNELQLDTVDGCEPDDPDIVARALELFNECEDLLCQWMDEYAESFTKDHLEKLDREAMEEEKSATEETT